MIAPILPTHLPSLKARKNRESQKSRAGLIPFKTLTFDSGVNFTAGLPIIRTSPAHGTAYELAGKNQASADSFREAVYLAIDIYRNRIQHQTLTANPLKLTIHDEERPGSEPKLVL